MKRLVKVEKFGIHDFSLLLKGSEIFVAIRNFLLNFLEQAVAKNYSFS